MLSRVFKALQKISVMTHNKIEALTDFTPSRVALQNQLGALQQKRGLGRMFLGSQLLQPPIEVLRDTEIHSHTFMVPKRYLASMLAPAVSTRELEDRYESGLPFGDPCLLAASR